MERNRSIKGTEDPGKGIVWELVCSRMVVQSGGHSARRRLLHFNQMPSLLPMPAQLLRMQKVIANAAVHCQLNNSVRNLAKHLLTTTSALENDIHAMMDDPTLLMSYKVFLHNIKWSRLLCCEKTIKPQSHVMTEKTGQAIKEFLLQVQL